MSEELIALNEQQHTACGLSLNIDIISDINYSLLMTGFPIMHFAEIINSDDIRYEHITLLISADCDLVEPAEYEVDFVGPNSSVLIPDLRPAFNPAILASVTEKSILNLTFSLIIDNSTVYSTDREITVLAFDEWCGSGFYPEVLSAFCVPNHPSISSVLYDAAAILGEWTGDPSFDAYQTHDPDRVCKQAAAIYEALACRNIVYCVSAASYEEAGQRIRLTDAVLEQKLANCLDISLCYCSCLEAAGLHPFIVVKHDHAFAGVWLDDLTFPESVEYDPTAISKRMAGGISELTVVECTSVTVGRAMSFEEASATAASYFAHPEEIEFTVDIKRARMSGIRPLPTRIMTDHGYEILCEEPVMHGTAQAPSTVNIPDINISTEETPFTRKALWERRLLDLGLRNQLINLRMSKTLLPILSASLDTLENALSDGMEFALRPRPADFNIPENSISFDNIHELFPNTGLLESEFRGKRLRTTLTETQLANTAKELYRSAKSSFEENGANTLYMALGLLRWYETEKSVKPRYAPLILVPIDMLRKSAAGGYTIRLRDDEPQINITILEKLKQDFKIIINGLDPLPMDEHGIDLRTVFTILRKCIMNQPRWDILESAYLGIFTFSQFVMWNDIKNRSDELEKNKIVRSLVEQKLAWDAAPMEIGETVDTDGVLLPLSADASQIFAIKEAAEGASFVLHGPPGTGKSQTITALIANALAAGKRVLFVAEKMAALSVVEKRLNKLGIGDFCLELHSNKSRKRDVLDQLEAACNITKNVSSDEYARNAEKLSKLRLELDRYCKSLHKKQSYGLSCHDLINLYEEHRNAPDIGEPDTATLSKMNVTEFEACHETVSNLVSAGQLLGHPSTHPLIRVKLPDYDHSLAARLVPYAQEYKKALAVSEAQINDAAASLGLKLPVTYSEISVFIEVIEILKSWLNYPSVWAQQDNFRLFFNGITSLCDEFACQADAWNAISAKWTDEFFSKDPGSLLTQYREAENAFLFMKSIKMNSLIKQLAPCSKIGITKETLPDELSALLKYKETDTVNKRRLIPFENVLAGIPHTSFDDWKELRKLAESALASIERLYEILPDASAVKRLCGNGTYRQQLTSASSALQNCENTRNAFYLAIAADPTPAEEEFFSQENLLCDNVLNNTDLLKDICLWNRSASDAQKYGIGPIITAYEAGLAHDMIQPAYYKALSQSLISYITDHDEYLNTFSDVLFNDKIRQFRELDEKLTELSKKEIYAKLAANVPNFQAASAQSSETGILQRAIKSNGRGTSIRKLFSQIPNLLPRLTPCMLMSPISAAQYLAPSSELFDLVVFDEASQLPTAKAVGAIARGKEAVIVGDPNQMPPTSFFMSDSTDEDNLDSEDLESILDDCLAIQLPQTHLLWHYRSRHESLIAFSNNEFYENRLYTFPSVNDRESKVSFVHVDGYFDRGKTRQNLAEAKAIVEEIKRRCYDDSINKLSIGVVTFNISQSNLIDDLILEACREDAHLENWLYNQEEPLFIKNLENVQGDERDSILFSVGYGTDKDGKTYMNFGPLNRDGGWRRLNVAVSRARAEMIVFSSLTAEQIDLARTSSQGVAALKAFLEYAEKGTLRNMANNVTFRKPERSGIIDSICRELNANGYATETFIGHSAYHIDIGVPDPNDPAKYLLGILTDGSVYASAQTTRDREYAQIGVLEGLGWNIARVWSVSWFENRSREVERLLRLLKQAEKTEKNISFGSNAADATQTAGAQSIADEADGKSQNSGNATDSKPQDAANKADMKPQDTADGKTQDAANKADSKLQNAANAADSKLQNAANAADGKLQKTADGSEKSFHEYCPLIPETTPLSAEEFLAASHKKEILRRMENIINHDAPITRDALFKRILTSYEIPRSTQKLNDYLNSLVDSLKLLVTLQNDNYVIWSSSVTPNDFSVFRTSEAGSPARRDIREIPIEEIRLAAVYVTECQVSLSNEDLIRETAKLFGFTRTGEAINSSISLGISFAIMSGSLKADANGRISISRNSR